MIHIHQSDTFRKWLTKLKDLRGRTIITGRINRLAEGLAGDVEPIGNGLSELRIHYGPGYRVYFMQRGSTVIVLLSGGDKASQRRDIAQALKIAQEWIAQHD